jgi:hypothetical protein
MKYRNYFDDAFVDAIDRDVRQVWHRQETRVTHPGAPRTGEIHQSIKGSPDPVDRPVGRIRIVLSYMVANGLKMS